MHISLQISFILIVLCYQIQCANTQYYEDIYETEMNALTTEVYKNVTEEQSPHATTESATDVTYSTEAIIYTESFTSDTSLLYVDPESTSISQPTTTEKTTTKETTTEETSTGNPECESYEIKLSKIFSGTDSIYIEWNQAPAEYCNFQYFVTWLEDKFNTTSENFYTIENLVPCTKYDFRIYVIDNPSIGIRNSSANTKEVDLKIDNLYTQEYEDYINITWTIPDSSKNCVKSFKYEVEKDGVPIFSSETSNFFLPVYNITHCAENTYTIYAVSITNVVSPGQKQFYSNFIANSPPELIKELIFEDHVVTEWNFGKLICRPKWLYIECYNDKNKEEFHTYNESITTNKTLVAYLTKLLPYSNYSCSVSIENDVSKAEITRYMVMTKPTAPDTPFFLHINKTTDNYLNIYWLPPVNWNGEKESYNLTLEMIGLNYEFPNKCDEETMLPNLSILINNTDTLIWQIGPNETEASANYTIYLSAKSDGGWSNYYSTEITTNDREPGDITLDDFEVEYIENDVNYKAYLNVSWIMPCKTNGILENLTIYLSGTRQNYPIDLRIVALKPINEKYHYNIFDNLKPEYQYEVQIVLKTRYFEVKSENKTFNTDSGIPESSTLPEAHKLLGQDNNDDIDATTQAKIFFSNELFSNANGEILYYAIIVAQEECEENPRAEVYQDWPDLITFNNCSDDKQPYQTTENFWNPFSTTTNKNDLPKTYTYILGNSTGNNKPLKPETNYLVKIRGITRNTFKDTSFFEISTDAEINLALIIGLVVGILGIAFIIAAILFYTNGRLNFKNWPRMDSTTQISPAPPPVSIKKFDSHYKKMTENLGKIKNEFQLLITISSDVTLSTKTASLPVNKKKNRYINILPYDTTRVKLQEYNSTSTDYINASFVKGYSGSNEYIATQGPTEATCPSFWQMILEQNIKLIVMLTQFVEMGKEKCYKYFPDLNEEYDLLNDIKIQCVEEQLLTLYNRRTFKLIKGQVTKKITHVQFNLWPDFGVPTDVKNLIDFCEIIKEIKLKKPTIILIHCSAGVGRTGTLIAMEILLQTIRDKRKIDIFGTVLNLRKQRMSMVQSEKQYEFLYKCVHFVLSNNEATQEKNQQLSQIRESNM